MGLAFQKLTALQQIKRILGWWDKRPEVLQDPGGSLMQPGLDVQPGRGSCGIHPPIYRIAGGQGRCEGASGRESAVQKI